MYEKIAWNSFCKTGNLESFLEYKRLNEINSKVKDNEKDNIYKIDIDIDKKGDDTSEFNKG